MELTITENIQQKHISIFKRKERQKGRGDTFELIAAY